MVRLNRHKLRWWLFYEKDWDKLSDEQKVNRVMAILPIAVIIKLFLLPFIWVFDLKDKIKGD